MSKTTLYFTIAIFIVLFVGLVWFGMKSYLDIKRHKRQSKLDLKERREKMKRDLKTRE
jgi:amino acid permease